MTHVLLFPIIRYLVSTETFKKIPLYLGKGESVWDRFVHSHPVLIKYNATADIADDSYNQWPEDIRQLKLMGVRLEPQGNNQQSNHVTGGMYLANLPQKSNKLFNF